MPRVVLIFAAIALIAACERADQAATSHVPAKEQAPSANDRKSLINPENWPRQEPVMRRDPEMEQRIAKLLSRMTLEEKVGQVIQADIASVTPQQVSDFNLGSVLNGGGSAPDNDLRNAPDAWLALADAFWEASTDKSDGGVGIPAIWGTDAVHGHSNIVGATIFPHNIGLGAANDPDLMYEIGRVTALEMLATGHDWTFAPTIAVVRNDRWGRTYEGYSEDPRIVAAYAPRIVEGIQGVYGSDEFLDEDRMLATAKHFVGDGGTVGGKDQGDNVSTEAELRDIHAAGYPPAIAAGVQSVMASYNSFHGRKLHGYGAMLDDVLVGRMGFDGFVVGDWNGHGQVSGCSNESCPAAFNAGLDMFMAPDSWQPLYRNTLEQVRSGEIGVARLDEAVARILRVKMRAGVFEAPRPSERSHAGNWSLLGAPEHREVARRAVRQSLVLLKNEDGILPLAPGLNVLVAGDGANDIGKQCGGWTLSWQGTGNSNQHFPNGVSIFEGIREALETSGGSAVLSESGEWETRPDVAIVVFGENPYAEFQGDRENVDYPSDDGLTLLRRFQARGIPTVSVFISGRPLWVNPELNVSNAFVAAWLPGSEGGGIADILIADSEGNPRYDFTGRLSYSWPANALQAEVNVGDKDYAPLFAYGYGLSYAEPGHVPRLSEDSELDATSMAATGQFIEFGDAVGTWSLNLGDEGGSAVVADSKGSSPAGAVAVRPADHEAQEDTLLAQWTGTGQLEISGGPADFRRQTNGDLVLEIRYRVLAAGADAVSLSMVGSAGEGALDLTRHFSKVAGADWHTTRLRLACFAELGADMAAISAPFVITADGALELQLASVRLAANPGGAGCTP